jgi:quinol monooxygenase YgiN
VAYVAWNLDLQVKDGRSDELRALMAEMVEATQRDEPGTLNYEWHLTPDGSHCHLYERYTDSEAALVHMGNFGAKYAGRFFDILQAERFVVYGSPNEQVRGALGAMGAVITTPVAGFAR